MVRINEVQDVFLAVPSLIAQAHRFKFDGNARSCSRSMESNTWASISAVPPPRCVPRTCLRE